MAAVHRDWVSKLTEAKNKFNTTGVGIVSVDLFSVEAIKVCPVYGAADTTSVADVCRSALVQRWRGPRDRPMPPLQPRGHPLSR